MNPRTVGALAILMLPGRPALAQTRAEALSSLYDDATLRYWQGRYEISTAKLKDLIIQPGLPSRLESKLAMVHFEHPMPRDQNGQQAALRGDPLQYYSNADPNQPQVFLPVLSMKFLDDLCVAYTWREAHGGSIDEVFNYVAELKYRKSKDFPGGRYPQPLEALHIPDNALQDPEVNERSLGRFTTARAFIVGHELGHVMGCNNYPKPVDREICADALGARVVRDFMRRTQVAPLGVVIYFMAALHWEPNQADFNSPKDWRDYVDQADHPLTSARLGALASALEADSGGNGDMLTVAEKIHGIAKAAANIYVLQSIILVAQAGDSMRVSEPAGRSSRPPHPSQLPFSGNYVGKVIIANDVEDGPATLYVALERHGDLVTGRYTFGLGDATLQGKIVDGKLYFHWTWGQYYGSGVLEVAENGSGFRGTWGFRGSSQGGGTWDCHQQD